MKKIALVLAILLVGTLFGCAAKEDSNTLYVLNWGDYIDPTVIPLFEEENPDIKIKFHCTGSCNRIIQFLPERIPGL